MADEKKICQHVGSRGGNADVQCKNRAKIGNYCVKHKKKKVNTNLADDPVLKDTAPKTQVAAPNHKFSVWKFTLNSQKDFSKMTGAEKTNFKNAVEFVFNDQDLPKYLADRTSPEDSRKNIVKIKVEWYAEVGEKVHRLHVHGVVDLTHSGNYQLDIPKIKKLFEQLLGKNIYFNASGSGNAEAAWAAYMSKSGEAKQVEL